MFGKPRTKTPSSNIPASPVAAAPSRKATPSVLSADMNVLGNIISEGFLDINGRIEGNVKCENATIREQGLVKGDVVADSVQIYGKVEGLVRARHVVLYATSHVTGIIMHESLSIEDGAFIDGKLKRTDKVFIEDDMPTGGEVIDSDPAPRENIMDSLRLISA